MPGCGSVLPSTAVPVEAEARAILDATVDLPEENFLPALHAAPSRTAGLTCRGAAHESSTLFHSSSSRDR